MGSCVYFLFTGIEVEQLQFVSRQTVKVGNSGKKCHECVLTRCHSAFFHAYHLRKLRLIFASLPASTRNDVGFEKEN